MYQRKHKRTRFIYRLRARVAGQERDFVGQLVNANPEGMLLFANDPLAPDSRLTLQVDLPQNAMGAGQAEFEAVVRWCEPNPGTGQYAIGLQLEHVPPASHELLSLLQTRFQELEPAEDDPYVRNRGDDPLFS
ncbi:hypothetical protein E4656_14540 [Natronospirillum operosum]|uniref:PilZ domain-containing protein n=1 Tax=Natronospirillum operosum TaxID=2759953 RepID=A0A4Z0W9T8_9GAMM|nr:PilZ domain-containing protein [Natronospirillum operosum]TGG92093.1 hypothetical protein E4656_14540 [Natronospirillum operosum]